MEGECGWKMYNLRGKGTGGTERSNVPLITLSFNPEAGVVNTFLDI